MLRIGQTLLEVGMMRNSFFALFLGCCVLAASAYGVDSVHIVSTTPEVTQVLPPAALLDMQVTFEFEVVTDAQGLFLGASFWHNDHEIAQSETVYTSQGVGTETLPLSAVTPASGTLMLTTSLFGNSVLAEDSRLFTVGYLSAPTGLRALAGADNVLLRWDANPEFYVAGYWLYRAEQGSDSYEKINSEPIQQPEYLDTALPIGGTYDYYVTATAGGDWESEPSSIVSAEVGVIEIWMPDISAPSGATDVRLPVNIRNARGITTQSLDVWLNYPASLFRIAGSPEKTAISVIQSFFLFTGEPVPGDYRIIGGNAQSGVLLNGEGRLFDLILSVSDTAISGSQGTVSFQKDHVTFYDETLIHRLPVNADDVSVFTVSPNFIMADVDGDGDVDQDDVNLIRAFALGLQIPTPRQWDAANINGDDRIDSADVVLAMRIVAGLPTNPGSEGTMSLSTSMLRSEPYRASLSSGVLPQRGVVKVWLSLNDPAGVSGSDFQINYDPDVLMPLEVLRAPGLETMEVASNVNSLPAPDAAVRVIVSGTGTLAPGVERLFAVVFAARKDISVGQQTRLTLASAKLSGQFGQDAAWDAPVEVEGCSVSISEWTSDLNGDGFVNYLDLFEFSRFWWQPFRSRELLGFRKE